MSPNFPKPTICTPYNEKTLRFIRDNPMERAKFLSEFFGSHSMKRFPPWNSHTNHLIGVATRTVS